MNLNNLQKKKLNIFVFGNKGYAGKIIEKLIDEEENVVGICCKKKKQLKFKDIIYNLINFFNIPIIENFSFQDPFKNQKDPESFAKKKNIPVLYSCDLHSEKFKNYMKSLSPDLIIVSGFHRLIPRKIFNLSKKCSINIHPSLLPLHKGGTPNRWVVRNGELNTGISVHLLSDAFDQGKIIYQKKIKIKNNSTWGDVEIQILDLIENNLPIIIKKIFNNKYKKIKTSRLGSYEKSYNRDKCNIDWNLAAEEIKRICYAIKPKSGGITKFKDKRLCLWELEIIKNMSKKNNKGTVIKLDRNNCPIISCGKDSIKILSFLSMGKIILAKKIVNKLNIKKGSVFYN